MADISKKLDAKVKNLEVGELGNNLLSQSKKLRDLLSKKDKDKAAAGLKVEEPVTKAVSLLRKKVAVLSKVKVQF